MVEQLYGSILQYDTCFEKWVYTRWGSVQVKAGILTIRVTNVNINITRRLQPSSTIWRVINPYQWRHKVVDNTDLDNEGMTSGITTDIAPDSAREDSDAAGLVEADETAWDSDEVAAILTRSSKETDETIQADMSSFTTDDMSNAASEGDDLQLAASGAEADDSDHSEDSEDADEDIEEVDEDEADTEGEVEEESDSVEV
jgi:hypothetical protein